MKFIATTAVFGAGFKNPTTVANLHMPRVGRSAVIPVNISNGMPNVVHKGVLAEPRNFNKVAISRKNILNRGDGPQLK